MTLYLLDGNTPPHADAGPDVLVKLPTREAALDGSRSSDDYGIVKYIWLRHSESPAAGVSFHISYHYIFLKLLSISIIEISELQKYQAVLYFHSKAVFSQ